MKNSYSFKEALMLFSFLFFMSNFSISQTLSYQDLVNLQKTNLDKANGFFNYKNFTWNSSEKDRLIQIKGHHIVYDIVKWKKYNEEVLYLTKSGHENIIVYFADNYSFSEIENEAKKVLKQESSKIEDNLLKTSYSNQKINLDFISKKKNDYSYDNVKYEIFVYNKNDLNNRIKLLCDNCKGSGQISVNEKCSYCTGVGKKNCEDCRGNGKLLCRYCKEGYDECDYCDGKGKNNCNLCSGKTTTRCNNCYGKGTTKCNKCYGDGKIQTCPRCSGAGKVSESVLNGLLIQTYTCPDCAGKGRGNFVCSECSGKGKLNCSQCGGIGNFPCSNCNSIGTLKCNHCSGNGKIVCSQCKGMYSKSCVKCLNTGYSHENCYHCDGSGLSGKKITQVCSVCNGNKLKIKN